METVKYHNNDKSILLEYYRLELLQNILIQIKSEYINFYNNTIDVHKNKKINSFISLWIMNQYNNIETKEIIPDPIFPYNRNNNSQLEKNLSYTKIANNKEDASELIARWNLKEKMTLACVEVSKFMESTEYHIAKHNYKVETYQDKNYENQIYTRIKILSPDLKRFKYRKPVKFSIPSLIYNQLITRYGEYIPIMEDRVVMITILLLRYYILDSDNQQLAIMPEFYSFLGNKYKITIELFASGFNCFFPQFASLYYDLEAHIGSIGYFNNFNINIENKDGYFLIANPPFDEEIMFSMADKFLNWLSQDVPISILLTIPQWGEYATFETYNKFKYSGFIKYYSLIPKSLAKYYNYLKGKIVYPCNIYLILLQNFKGYEQYNNLANDIEFIKNKIYIKT
jgi:hypothetical protein